MNKSQKAGAIEELEGVFGSAGVVVVVHYAGLTVADMNDLRGRLREQGGKMKVVKNRLAKRALAGAAGDDGDALFKGPVAIAYSEDPISAPKAVAGYAKDNDKLVIIGAVMGADALDAVRVKDLASLPSLDQLRGKLVGLLQAPATKIAGVTQAPAGQLARVFSAYGNKDAA